MDKGLSEETKFAAYANAMASALKFSLCTTSYSMKHVNTNSDPSLGNSRSSVLDFQRVGTEEPE